MTSCQEIVGLCSMYGFPCRATKGLSSSPRETKEGKDSNVEEGGDRKSGDVRGDPSTAVYALKICDEQYRVVGNSDAEDIRSE